MPTKSPLPEMWRIPPVFRTRVRESVGRQRAMFADGHLLLILHEPPKGDERERRARVFWRSPEGEWQSSTLGPGAGALQRHLNDFREAVASLDKAEDRADRAEDFFRLLRDVAPLARTARNLADVLQDARQMVPDDPELILFRDQAYQASRSADLLQHDMKIGLDCAIARRSEEQAESSRRMALAAYRLNVLAATFFPIVTVASIFGMNLDHGLGARYDPWLFWLLLALGVVGGFFLKDAIVNRPDRPKPRDPNKEV
jgi:hypothetical protein